jgi:uncharacterized membrane protein YhaH (DUF805 family)
MLWNAIINVVLAVITVAAGASVISATLSMAGGGFGGFGGYGIESFTGGLAGMLVLYIAWLAFGVANIIPTLSLFVRRLHDTGKRWYWIIIYFIPFIIALLIVVISLASMASLSLSGLAAVSFLSMVDMIASIACTIIWIILMCQPTSPNAIGISTHDGMMGGGYQGGSYPSGGYQGGYPAGGYAQAIGIVGTAGMYKNVTFPIDDYEEMVIGRDAAFSHIVIDQNAEKISRKHVSIGYDPGEGMYIVTDLSSNGTYMDNGTRLTANVAMKLPRGSVIYLAKPDNSFKLG